MKYLQTIGTVILGLGLTFSLFHIGRLNLRYNHVHEELNACSETLAETKEEAAWKLEECEHNLKLKSDEWIEAIEKSTAYCRG